MSLNRRAFLKTAAASAALLANRPLWGATSEAPPETDDALLARVRGDIAKHRQGDGMIVVRGADGQPIANAKVKVEQTRHEFLFGCNSFRFARLRDAKQEEDYQQRFAALLNYATLPFYWANYEPQQGESIYDYSERTADWCQAHGIACKGHPLVWDHPAGNPRWLPADLPEIGRLSHERVREIVSRFKDRIAFWDVVNEATHLGQVNKEQRMSQWAVTLGATKYVSEHLKIARAANPKATLLVNDYRLDPAYYRLLVSLRAEGKLLFDAVGLQSHMHDGGWPLHRLWKHCDTFRPLGLPLHFTETTVLSGPRTGPGESWGPTTPALEAKQADYVVKFYTALFAHPAVQAITWWDFSDNGAWQRAAAGFLRADMSPKPVYDRLLKLVKGEWWTKTAGRANERGEFPARAFFGTHRVTVELPNGRMIVKEFLWQRGKENRFEMVA